MNEHGIPHGWCSWRDSHPHGEHLHGLFHGGIPLGPFTSWEHGSGSSFVARTYGVFFMRKDNLEARPKRKPGFGPHGVLVCSVESSVSGLFFRGYPKVTGGRGLRGSC